MPIDADDIGGVVTSTKGPEAGVWVIAETTDLPTKFARIVVTDDRGRYLHARICRSASYEVFVRGYGLVDSARHSTPGQQLNLKAATSRPTRRPAAQVYPAAWWLSMIALPGGLGRSEEVHDGREGVLRLPPGSGNKATREITPAMSAGAVVARSVGASRTKVGPSGRQMGTFVHEPSATHRQGIRLTGPIASREARRQDRAAAARRASNATSSITEWDWGTPTDGRSDNAAGGHARCRASERERTDLRRRRR